MLHHEIELYVKAGIPAAEKALGMASLASQSEAATEELRAFAAVAKLAATEAAPAVLIGWRNPQ
jgi:hypothetical protein